MHGLQNIVARQWSLTINVWADGKQQIPRDLTGYRAICLDLHPHHITCSVDLIRPKTQGIVRAIFIDDGADGHFTEDERVFCELGLQDKFGKIERLAEFSIEIS